MRYQVKSSDETIDQVCLFHYGATADYTEMVLAANPHLSAKGVFLALGAVIELQEVKTVQVSTMKSLWD